MQDDVEVSFCDLCGTSVPAGDLATGSAVSHQGKTIGACCLSTLRAGAPVAVPGALAADAPALVRPAPAEARILPAAIVVLAAIAAATIFLDQRMTAANDRYKTQIEKLGDAQASDSQVLGAFSLAMDSVPRRADHLALVEKVDGIAVAVTKGLGEQRKQIEALATELAAVGAEQRTLAGKVIDYKPLFEDLRERQVRLADLVATLRAVAPATENTPAAPAPAQKQPEEANAAPALPQALADAVKKLQSQDPAVRFEAADVLLRSKEPSVLSHLTPLARDPDRFVRSLIVDGLRTWKRPEAVEALLQSLADSDDNVRDMAWRSLKEVTGQKLPFESTGGKDARARAIQKWQEWWDKNKATFGA